METGNPLRTHHHERKESMENKDENRLTQDYSNNSNEMGVQDEERRKTQIPTSVQKVKENSSLTIINPMIPS